MRNNEIIDFSFFEDNIIDVHKHQDIEIIFVLEGSLMLQIGMEKFYMKEGDFVVVNSNKSHSCMAEESFLAASFMIRFQLLSSLLETSQLLFWCNTLEEKNRDYQELRRLMHLILNQYFDQSRNQTKIYLRSLYYQLLHRLIIDHMVYADREEKVREDRKSERIQDIKDYIQANYQRQISLNELAEKMYLSVGYLSKYIKRQLNMGFMDYVNSVRLFHAVEDLLYTDKSITKIIYDNGFPNAAAFNKLFLAKYEVTPSAYRNQKSGSQIFEQRESKALVEPARIQTYLENNNLYRDTISVKTTYDLTVNNDEGKLLKQNWCKVINLGELEDLMDAKMQEHVLILIQELKFTHVRLWNIFQEEMYHRYESGFVDYNFAWIDTVLDFLVKNGIHLYMELGTKPKNIHKDVTENLISHPWKTIFDNQSDYQSVIRQFVIHIVNRYGISEVEQWYFEIWWPMGDASKEIPYPEDWYYEIFEITYRTLKQFSFRIRLGGFGILMEQDKQTVEQRLRRWGEKDIKPDFISIYCYPYQSKKDGNKTVATRSADRSYTLHQILELRELMVKMGLEECTIHVTEWSNTISNRNSLNDSCFKGAYVMKNLMECLGQAEVMAYWHGSDLFGAAYDTKSICFGDSGLLTTNACRKPVFYGISFMNSLYDNMLGMNEHAIITYNGGDKYAIACHNYKHYGYKFYLQDENLLAELAQYELFEDNDAITIRFQIHRVNNGFYSIQINYLNNNNGSVQDELYLMGGVKNLSIAELEYLKRICMPHVRASIVKVEDEILKFETKLSPNEIQGIQINYRYDMTTS